MASHFINLSTCFIFLMLFSCFQFSEARLEFEAGADDGWTIPANDTEFYNKWASENRFRVGDTIRFNYTKDSVMVVSEADYNRCNSAHPILYFNDGNTVFTLDRSGDFYFISGVAGHCQKGQKMIVRVLSKSSGDAPESPEGGQTGLTNSPPPPGSGSPSVAAPRMAMARSTISMAFISLFLGFLCF